MIIFYSGFSDNNRMERLKELIENGMELKHAGILVTYINIMDSEKKVMRKLDWFHEKGLKIMVDSGAHSIQYVVDRKEGLWMGHDVSKVAKEIVENESYDDYVERYISFAKKWKDTVDVFVELDIQRVVGMEKVKEWRNWWREEGIEVMYVWHGENEVYEWAKETEYIGFGGTELEKRIEEMYRVGKRLKEVRDDVWIHVFALTSFDWLRKGVGIWDSVDSSSWSMASRYGMVYKEANGKLVPVSWRDDKNGIRAMWKKWRNEIEKCGFDVDSMMEFKDFKEIDMWNLFIMDWYMDKILSMSGKRVKSFSCAVCPVADKCAYYSEDAEECKWIEEMMSTMDLENVMEDTIRFVIESRIKRYLRGLAMEELDMGLLDKHVTQLEEGIVKMIETYLKLKYPERYSGKGRVVSDMSDFDEILKRIDSLDE